MILKLVSFYSLGSWSVEIEVKSLESAIRELFHSRLLVCTWSTKLKKDIVTSQRTATTTVTRPATAHFSPSFLTSFVSREEKRPDADHWLTHAMHRHRGTDGQRTRGGGGAGGWAYKSVKTIIRSNHVVTGGNVDFSKSFPAVDKSD